MFKFAIVLVQLINDNSSSDVQVHSGHYRWENTLKFVNQLFLGSTKCFIISVVKDSAAVYNNNLLGL